MKLFRFVVPLLLLTFDAGRYVFLIIHYRAYQFCQFSHSVFGDIMFSCFRTSSKAAFAASASFTRSIWAKRRSFSYSIFISFVSSDYTIAHAVGDCCSEMGYRYVWVIDMCLVFSLCFNLNDCTEYRSTLWCTATCCTWIEYRYTMRVIWLYTPNFLQ